MHCPSCLLALPSTHGRLFHRFHRHFVSHGQLLEVVRPVTLRPGFLLIPYRTYDMEAGDRTSETLLSVARGWSPDLIMFWELVGVMFSAIRLPSVVGLDSLLVQKVAQVAEAVLLAGVAAWQPVPLPPRQHA